MQARCLTPGTKPYNGAMTARNASSICSSALFASLLAAALAMPAAAQTTEAPAADSPPETGATATQPSGIESKAEYIHHEDDQTRIDEVRIGGETRSIRVQPKTGAPGYEISPTSPGQFSGSDDQNGQGNAGRSRWRILTF